MAAPGINGYAVKLGKRIGKEGKQKEYRNIIKNNKNKKL